MSLAESQKSEVILFCEQRDEMSKETNLISVLELVS